MSKKQKEHYKVLSDNDRKRFDTEKKLVKKAPKKRDSKHEEKKSVVKGTSQESENEDDISQNSVVDKSSGDHMISFVEHHDEGLNFKNVAEAYINDNEIFTTAATSSTARIRSLEHDSEGG
jgi:hypothetical protein